MNKLKNVFCKWIVGIILFVILVIMAECTDGRESTRVFDLIFSPLSGDHILMNNFCPSGNYISQ